MSLWIANLAMALSSRGVIVLHGNVRDQYIDADSRLHADLGDLLRQVALAREPAFDDIHWYNPLPSEWIEHLRPTDPEPEPPAAQVADPGDDLAERRRPPTLGPEVKRGAAGATFEAWTEAVVSSPRRRLMVVNYLDKIVPYQSRYQGEELKAIIHLERLIQKITPGHCLVLIALTEGLVPIEVFTHSPHCHVIEVPRPDMSDRERFIRTKLRDVADAQVDHRHLRLLANLADGLCLQSLVPVLTDIRERESSTSVRLSPSELRKLVNRYRVGVEKDPWEALDTERLAQAKEWFTTDQDGTTTTAVRGQDQAVQKVVDVLCIARAGLSGLASGRGAKPKGVLFFAGPTGVGKTMLARRLAEFLFDTPDAFVRLDMSEFKEEHSGSKLIGAPPGYVGHEQGGQLTNQVRERPFTVVLFDEVEKAHPRILDVFLQLLDEGRVTDSRGQTVFFTETVVIFTSNLGCRTTDSQGRETDELTRLNLILANDQDDEETRRRNVAKHFRDCVEYFFLIEISRPELLNRIGDNVVPFNQLNGRAIQVEIVSLQLRHMETAFGELYSREGYRISFAPGVAEYLVDRFGTEVSSFGGRGLANLLEAEVLPQLSRTVLRWLRHPGQPQACRVSAGRDGLEYAAVAAAAGTV